MKHITTRLLIAIVAGGLVLGATLARAQDDKGEKKGKGRPGAGMVQARMDRLNTELNLTDEQKPKVKEVLEDGMKKMQELRSDSNLSPEDRRTKYQDLRKEEDTKLKAILTPEQFQKYEKIREQNRPMRKGKGEGEKGEGKGDNK